MEFFEEEIYNWNSRYLRVRNRANGFSRKTSTVTELLEEKSQGLKVEQADISNGEH